MYISIICTLISSRIWNVLVYTFLSLLSLVVGIPDNLIHSSGKLTSPLNSFGLAVSWCLFLPRCFYFGTGDVTGKITFHQMEGNYTYLRDSGDLASDVPTLVSFKLSDPRRNFRSVVFMYTWDLGNG